MTDQQLDNEKYLAALCEVVRGIVSGFQRDVGVASIIGYIVANTSPETFLFLRYNGLTTEFVSSWLKSRSENKGE